MDGLRGPPASGPGGRSRRRRSPGLCALSQCLGTLTFFPGWPVGPPDSRLTGRSDIRRPRAVDPFQPCARPRRRHRPVRRAASRGPGADHFRPARSAAPARQADGHPGRVRRVAQAVAAAAAARDAAIGRDAPGQGDDAARPRPANARGRPPPTARARTAPAPRRPSAPTSPKTAPASPTTRPR